MFSRFKIVESLDDPGVSATDTGVVDGGESTEHQNTATDGDTGLDQPTDTVAATEAAPNPDEIDLGDEM